MKSSWMYIGFSHHSVPSLSKTATRASGATKSGPLGGHPADEVDDRRLRGPVGPGGEFCHAQPPRVARNFSSSSTAWLIVNDAGSCRGGNSLNVSRNCVDDRGAVEHQVDAVDQPVPVGVRRDVGALERVGAQVEQLRRPQWGERLEPDLQRALAALLLEHDLPVLRPDAEHVAVVGEVDHPAARALVHLAGQVRQQVVAVDVHLVGHVAGLVALLELLDDVRITRGGQERRQPIMVLHNLVGDRARLDLSRPADHLRDAEGALPVGGLLAAERGGRAVGPAVGVRAVVGASR